MMNEYPKMLYRAGDKGDCVIVEGVSFETLIVDNEDAELAADGFSPAISPAKEKPATKVK